MQDMNQLQLAAPTLTLQEEEHLPYEQNIHLAKLQMQWLARRLLSCLRMSISVTAWRGCRMSSDIYDHLNIICQGQGAMLPVKELYINRCSSCGDLVPTQRLLGLMPNLQIADPLQKDEEQRCEAADFRRTFAETFCNRYSQSSQDSSNTGSSCVPRLVFEAHQARNAAWHSCDVYPIASGLPLLETLHLESHEFHDNLQLAHLDLDGCPNCWQLQLVNIVPSRLTVPECCRVFLEAWLGCLATVIDCLEGEGKILWG